MPYHDFYHQSQSFPLPTQPHLSPLPPLLHPLSSPIPGAGESKEDFGALSGGQGDYFYEVSSRGSLPPIECAPDPCSPPQLPGLLSAFRFQNASQWGHPIDFFGDRRGASSSGFGITFPQGIDSRFLNYTLATLEGSGWVDRATRKAMVEANFYNPQIAQIAVTRFTVDISPAGSTSSHFFCSTIEARKLASIQHRP